MKKLLFVSALLLLPVSQGWSPRGDSLRFAPEKGLKLRKSYSHTGSQHLESMKLLINGEEHPMDRESFDRSGETHAKIVVTDEYAELATSHPAKLLRTFDRIQNDSVQKVKIPDRARKADGGWLDERTVERHRVSELEGKTVAFTWDEKPGAWVRTYEGGQGDQDLLEGLEEDMDFRGFLPGREVAKGDTWEIEVAAYKLFFSPGGELGERAEEEPDEERQAERQFKDNIEGAIKAEYLGLREVEGRKLAAIKIVARLKSSAEQETTRPDGSGRQTFAVEYEQEGELLWDPGAGHLASFTLEGEAEALASSESTLSRDDQTFEMRSEMKLKSQTKDEVVFERVE